MRDSLGKSLAKSEAKKFPRRRRLLLPVVASASMCCAVTAFAVRAHNTSSSGVERVAAPSSVTRPLQSSSVPSVPKSGTSVERLDIEVITIRPNGFERTQITRPKGLFGIAVENRSGLANITLRLDREGGSRLNQAALSREKPSWKLGLDLLPGRYVLTEAGNSDWVCHIAVTEK